MLEKNLFSSGFTDNKKKIVPTLSDDWTISSSYKNNHIQVRSIALNMSFDVSTSTFLSDCRTNDVSIKGNKIEGNYTFDKYRSLRTEEEFYQWEDEKEQSQVDEIKKADLIVGHSYILDDGSNGYYLGAKYISRITSKIIALENVGKISKKHIFSYTKSAVYGRRIGFISSKVVGLGDTAPLEIKEVDRRLANFYKVNPTFCYFEDYKDYNPVYVRKEVSNDIDPLLIELNGEEYVLRYMDKTVRDYSANNVSSDNAIRSSFTLIANQGQRWPNSIHNGTATKRFRYLVA